MLALFATLLELGIAIGHSLPREPSRAGLPKKEKGASWKSSSFWRAARFAHAGAFNVNIDPAPVKNPIVLFTRSLDGGFGRQIVQLTTYDFD